MSMADIPQYKSTLTGTEIDAAMKKMAENEIGDFVVEKQLADYVLKSALLDLVYPVGSVYISYNSASPAALFGGSWTQIQGRFLLAADSAHPAGSTGGDATHSHEYAVIYKSFYGALVGSDQEAVTVHDYATDQAAQAVRQGATDTTKNDSLSKTTNTTQVDIQKSTGRTSAESSLPPYLAVYVWKRTA